VFFFGTAFARLSMDFFAVGSAVIESYRVLAASAEDRGMGWRGKKTGMAGWKGEFLGQGIYLICFLGRPSIRLSA